MDDHQIHIAANLYVPAAAHDELKVEVERLRCDATACRRAWAEERAEVMRLREALSSERQARLIAEIELDRLRVASTDAEDER